MTDDRDIELERPTPDAAWRGALARRLAAAPAPAARPARLGRWIGGLAGGGGALLLIALTQV
jgi:predicted lipid-binding transport protein (Tim44 family)